MSIVRTLHQIGTSIFNQSAGPFTLLLPLCLCLFLSLPSVLLLYLFLCLYSCLIHGNKHMACWHNHQIGGSNWWLAKSCSAGLFLILLTSAVLTFAVVTSTILTFAVVTSAVVNGSLLRKINGIIKLKVLK